MIQVNKEKILLTKTTHEFENDGVLNPAAIRLDDDVHLFYRAVQEGNKSTIGYCRLNGPLTVVERWEKPFMVPEFEYESQGIEDPRIVKIDDTYYMTYTAYDGVSARGALAISSDFIHYEKMGLIVPDMTYDEFILLAETSGRVNENYFRNQDFYLQAPNPEKKIHLWDKDVVFFPRRINGKLTFLHRIRPGIQIVAVNNLKELTKEFWKNYLAEFQDHILLDPLYSHESGYIGAGCPPIETAHGWLLIYHGAEDTANGMIYTACAAALFDLEDPTKEIARLPYPLFSPEFEWELLGEVNNVVFPTGAVQFGETLYIYYGAADSRIACVTLNLPDLITELLSQIQIK
ncbi:MAG TPA: pesticidal protein Cry7Aa [Bacteroidales bacterium]|nr:MAG: pesticidal protein Cry7Aa [Bacteroidetes bacterium GWE2_42_24]OFY26750.1 MAG: pesticidal protein Cry7Aa [Bacteroidetes bacterium GWF2_43_11]HBZ68014.1 pesticidal protein Cry7Aa [Bacteroidales bacterium]